MQQSLDGWQAGFLTVMPAVQTHAQIMFRHLPLVHREEAVQEAIASAVLAYRRLAAQGHLNVRTPALSPATPCITCAMDATSAGTRMGHAISCRHCPEPTEPTGSTVLSPGYVIVEDGRITAVEKPAIRPAPGQAPGPRRPGSRLRRPAGQRVLRGGVRWSGRQAGWRLVAERLPETGTTAFMPTFITAPLPQLNDSLKAAAGIISRAGRNPGDPACRSPQPSSVRPRTARGAFPHAQRRIIPQDRQAATRRLDPRRPFPGRTPRRGAPGLRAPAAASPGP